MHTYEWTWTQQDHIRAHRATTKHALGLQKHSWLLVVAVILFAAAPLVVSLANGNLGALAGAAPWILLLLLWIAFMRYWVPKAAAKRLAKDDPSTKGPIRHVVSGEGFGVRSQAASLDLTWAHIKQVVETPEFFLYYYNPNCAYFTPRTAISEADLPDLRQTVRDAVGPRAKLLGTS